MTATVLELVVAAALLAAASVGLFSFAHAVRRWPALGLVLVSIVPLTIWEMPSAPQLLSIGGFSIYLDDVVVVVLLGAMVFNVARSRLRPAATHVAFAIGGALLVLGVVRGLAEYSVGPVIVEARSLLFVVAAGFWAYSVRFADKLQRRQVARRYAVAMIALLAGVATLHAVQHGLGSADDYIIDSSGDIVQVARILTSGQALMLGLSLLVLVGVRRDVRTGTFLALFVAGSAAIVLSQQRSAILAILVGGAVLFLRTDVGTKLKAVVLAGVVGTGLFVAVQVVDISSLAETLATSASSTGTYDGRVVSWVALIEQSVSNGLGSIVLGEPFGSGFRRDLGGGLWVEYAPHNMYVSLYLRAGLIGLLAFVVFMVAALVRSRVALNPAAGLALWVALFTFGWSYSWPWFVLPLVVLFARDSMVDDRVHRPLAHASSFRRESVALDR